VADEQPDLSEEQVERATSLLDIRRIIGSVLGIYGFLLIGAGVFGDHEVKNKAAGVNINLWVGFALLVASGLFWAWASTRPLVDELGGADDPDVSRAAS
jgi:drug/metabolite transporter (DMT)-like permease